MSEVLKGVTSFLRYHVRVRFHRANMRAPWQRCGCGMQRTLSCHGQFRQDVCLVRASRTSPRSDEVHRH